jgi:hypothetical protein
MTQLQQAYNIEAPLSKDWQECYFGPIKELLEEGGDE